MKPEDVLALQPRAAATSAAGSFGIGRGGFDGKALVAWLLVGVPIAWGVWVTLVQGQRPVPLSEAMLSRCRGASSYRIAPRTRACGRLRCAEHSVVGQRPS